MASEKSLLRFITCGSVDDGKSTLIGRLLFDCGALAEDQRAALEADSRAFASGGLDFSLLVDGLTAEREQGITIDVAYRYFSTPKRKFIVADTPGHEQYTRNMVTGASTADVALILIDARKGVLTQTRRHAFLASLMQVRQVALVVTKMDLIGYDKAAFEKISADFAAFAEPLKFASTTAIPASGVMGDNVATRGAGTPWYKGPTLLEYLEAAQVDETRAQAQPFRLAVQYVNRPNQDFRGFAGRIFAGAIAPGDGVRVLPSGRSATIARIVTADGDLQRGVAGQSVTLTFTEEIDCSRGDVIAAAGNPCEIADQFQCTLIWMSDTPLYPGRRYFLKVGARTINATVTDIRHRIDVETLAERPAKQLKPNEIGSCNISLDAPIPFDAFHDNRDTGGFILIDQVTHETAGAGLIRFALRRSHNIHWQSLEVDRNAHASIKGQKPAIVWFTGLSGAGKSTIANLVEKRLYSLGRHTVLLDGDNLRHGLNRDLGFTSADRVENLRRVGEVAKLMADAGLIVLVAFISPFAQEREAARNLVERGEFFEIFVDAPIDVLEARDPKGLYKKARAGELANFTGISSPYEAPTKPELRIDTTKLSAAEAAETIVAMLMAR